MCGGRGDVRAGDDDAAPALPLPNDRHICGRSAKIKRKRRLHVVGLRRAGYKASDLAALKKAYQILYRSGLKLQDALERIENVVSTAETLRLVGFIRRSKRGICRE